jgi:hypothetical protein
MDKLDKILGIQPADGTTRTDIVVTKDDIKEKIDSDFTYAREQIYNVLVKSQEAVEDMVDIARQSQHPKSYEVLNGMLKTLADVATNLVDLQKKQQEIMKMSGTQPSEQPQTINNNLFVGSTNELQKMIGQMRGQSD